MNLENCESETEAEKEEFFSTEEAIQQHIFESTAACILLDEIVLNNIQIQEVGDIAIPVSLQDVTKLQGASENGKFTRAFDPSLTRAWEIDSSKILTENLDLSSLVISHLGLPADKIMVTQAKLTKLIMYQAGGRYERNLNNSEKEFGTFLTAVLQLPVEGGYEGGRVRVESKGKSKLFDNHRNSDTLFYLTEFYDNFEYIVEPITKGWQLTLVFDLFWTNAKRPIAKPFDASVSLAALSELENVVNHWTAIYPNNPPVEKYEVPSAENENEARPAPLPSKIIAEESDCTRSWRPALKWQELAREQLSRDLHQIIAFWCAKPQRVWIEDPDLENGELTLRLLRLCITLRTREGGLALLNAIGSDFKSPTSAEDGSNSLQLFEGIQNERVAQAIAEFSCQVTDFDECADLVKRMISPNRLAKQFVPIIKLVHSFLDNDCIRGAITIGDWMAASVDEMDKSMVTHLDQSTAEAYLDSIVSLETHSEFSYEERIPSFVPFFRKLQISLQIHLVLGLKAQGTSRFKGVKSFQFTFQNLCKALCEEFYVDAPSVSDIIVDLITFYIKLQNVEFLQRLIYKICPWGRSAKVFFGKLNDAKDVDTKMVLLKKLVLSEEMWELSKSSKLGKTTLASFVGNNFTVLLEKLSFITKEEQQSAISQVESIGDALLCDFSSCLQFVIRMQFNPQLSNENFAQIAQLSVDKLWHLMNDLKNSESELFKNHPFYVKIVSHLCSSVVNQLKVKTRLMPRRETILNVVIFFVEFRGESSVKSLIKTVCDSEVTAPWDQHFKYELFNALLHFSDVWIKLPVVSKTNILNSCAKLAELWIAEISLVLDSNNTDSSIEIEHLVSTESRIYECAKLFTSLENKRYDAHQEDITSGMARALLDFSQKLSPSQLLRMLDCVFKPPPMQTASVPFEGTTVCLDWCHEMCELLFSKDVLSLSNLAEDASKIMDWLFWLDDDRCWQSFTDNVCASPCSERTHHFIRVFLLNPQIEEAIAENLPAFTTLNRIADHCANKWKSLEVPKFSWQMPKATVPDHPEVEKFLRSPEKTLRYTNLSDNDQMYILATDLEKNGARMGFSVSVTPDETFPCCEIVKTREYYTRVARDFKEMKSESDELTKLRQKVSRMRIKKNTKRSAPKALSSTLVPPAKRRTL
ncbi:uncharacterized protein LOC124196808 isoform X1 [Daphnia pulex]|uniref:uncharacterized protein LOC124196808 isoform X1 n=1 Tax=Daphnia pulex TaxID=6669 RepID=UPI001EDE5259|nr:uncharacterized protein LOC124196808 isoform X1 [Daphnia pulex]XP_046448009.1 uncharacterized protein LOC124196808 isoform X1 [Daphnia pulex]XP_046448016.1 uncharacterized protein LOC124196808 isoform X1 [Daphnia pulex]